MNPQLSTRYCKSFYMPALIQAYFYELSFHKIFHILNHFLVQDFLRRFLKTKMKRNQNREKQTIFK